MTINNVPKVSPANTHRAPRSSENADCDLVISRFREEGFDDPWPLAETNMPDAWQSICHSLQGAAARWYPRDIQRFGLPPRNSTLP